jgi:hypothetical protein
LKRIILILALITCVQAYSRTDFQKKEVLSIDHISISCDNQRLFLDVITSKPVHFELWNGDKLVLHAEGSAKGQEFFPIMRGKFKFILFDKAGKSKTRYFRI